MRPTRIGVFSCVVFLAMLFPGAALACLLGWDHRILGDSPEDVGDRFRLIAGFSTAICVVLAYVWFLRPLPKSLLANTLMVWFVVEIIQCLGALLLGDSWTAALSWRVMWLDLSYALLAVALVALSRAFKTDPHS